MSAFNVRNLVREIQGKFLPKPTATENGKVITYNDTNQSFEYDDYVGSASNLGTSGDGEGLFDSKSGVDLQFKRIKAGTNISLTSETNDVVINATGGGTGDVTGDTSSTDNAIARFDGITGKAIQNTTVTIDDSGSINIPAGQTYKINGTSLVGLPSGTQGDILYHNGTSFVALTAGTDGYYLKTQGSGANPTWAAVSGGSGKPAPLRFFSEGVVVQGIVGSVPKICEAGTITKLVVLFGGLPSATTWDSSNYIEFNVYKADMSVPTATAPSWTEISSSTTRINSSTRAGYYIQEFSLTSTTLTLGDLIKVEVVKAGTIASMGTDLQCMIYYDS